MAAEAEDPLWYTELAMDNRTRGPVLGVYIYQSKFKALQCLGKSYIVTNT